MSKKNKFSIVPRRHDITMSRDAIEHTSWHSGSLEDKHELVGMLNSDAENWTTRDVMFFYQVVDGKIRAVAMKLDHGRYSSQDVPFFNGKPVW